MKRLSALKPPKFQTIDDREKVRGRVKKTTKSKTIMDIENKDNLPQKWFREGWNTYLDYFLEIVPVLLIFKALTFGIPLLIWKFSQKQWAAYPYMLLIAVPLEIGLNLYFIKLARNEKASLGDIFKGFEIYKNAILVSVIYGLMVMGGTLLLIIPGIIIAIIYAFSVYAVIDKKISIMESFKYSAQITSNYRFKILSIFLMTISVHLLTPGIIKFEMGKTIYQLNFTLSAIIGYALITLIFIPWLKMSLAKAYVFLSDSNKEIKAQETIH